MHKGSNDPENERFSFGDPAYNGGYQPKYAKMALTIMQLKPGMIDTELADFFGVNPQEIVRWKHDHPDFKDAIFQGKEGSDMMVVAALFKKAVGFTEEVTKIDNKGGVHTVNEFFPPDTKAINLWLNNRRPADWKTNRPAQGQGVHTTKRVTNVIFTRGIRPGEEATDAVKAIEAAQDAQDEADDNSYLDFDETS